MLQSCIKQAFVMRLQSWRADEIRASEQEVAEIMKLPWYEVTPEMLCRHFEFPALARPEVFYYYLPAIMLASTRCPGTLGNVIDYSVRALADRQWCGAWVKRHGLPSQVGVIGMWLDWLLKYTECEADEVVAAKESLG